MLYDDFSDGLLSDNSADEDWWGSDDEWKASAITDREDRPIDHGKLGTSESTSTPPGDEMSAEYVPAWAVSERKDAKEKVCTVSTPGKEMPMIQWFSASTMPVSVGTNDDDDEVTHKMGLFCSNCCLNCRQLCHRMRVGGTQRTSILTHLSSINRARVHARIPWEILRGLWNQHSP